jgi:general stress protein 26
MTDIQQPGFAKLIAMIEAIGIGMLTTQEENGALRARPMETQKAEDGVLWFFTDARSPKIAEIEDEREVNVSYAAPDAQIYVSVSGLARMVRDKARLAQMWRENARRWFPEGVDSPGIALLEVRMTEAEYWDVDKGRMQRLLDAGETGAKLEEATEHKKIG